MTHLSKPEIAQKGTASQRRAKRLQVAALCYKDSDAGKKVLLITSRDTGRWIVPKGWPMKGKDDSEAALQEAWEEAGVSKAEVQGEPVGCFEYDKGLSSGEKVPVEAHVYLARVQNLKKSYPEVDQRKRAWFDPDEAAEMVDEPDLKEILRTF